MATRTAVKPQTNTDVPRTAQPQPEQPQRPAIWVQLVTPEGSTQPVQILIEAPDWEMQLDGLITQIKLHVLRQKLAAAQKQG